MAKYTKRLIRELCAQLRIIREQNNIPLVKVLNDLNMKEQTMEQVQKNFSAASIFVINSWNTTAMK